MKKSKDQKIGYLILITWAVITIYPLIFTLISSLRTQPDLFGNTFGFPRKIVILNYLELFTKMNITNYLMNSLVIASSALILQLISGAMASFILARFKFKANSFLLMFFLAGTLIPIQAVLIPIAVIAKVINGYNNYAFISIVYSAFGLPYTIFILTGFMKSIPVEIEEAAIVDGCPSGMVFWKIILPLSTPALAMMGILIFLGAWNELIMALILLKQETMKTISLGLIAFCSDRFSNYPGQCAAVIVSILPTLIIYFLLQENIIKGMTAGAVKG